MRNSQAQRYARWSAAAAAVLAVVVAGVYLRSAYQAKQAEKQAPPAVPASIEQQSNEFSYSKMDGQRTIYTVKASRTTEFKEGSRNLLEDVSIVVYGQKGQRNDTLTTRACDFISNTGKISCAGEVQINMEGSLTGAGAATGNSVQAVTSGILFDQKTGEARTDKPVTFHWPAGSGRAVGVSYDSNTGTLYLLHNVEMTVAPASPALPQNAKTATKSATKMEAGPPEQAVHLSGNSLTFRREARVLQIQGSVHAQQTSYELFADNLLIGLDSAFHARSLVATGEPKLRDADPQGAIALDAKEISAALRPDGSVDSIVADGNVRGDRNSPVSEDKIEAGRVQMNLVSHQNVPRLLTASGGAVLTSTAAKAAGGTRRVRSDALEIHFAGDSANASRVATAPAPMRVQSVDTLAPAQIEWQGVLASAGGKSVPQTTRMNGKQMSLQFDVQNQLQQLTSSGGVEVSRKLGDDAEQTSSSRDLTAKFDGAGQWTTIDQAGDVHVHDGDRAGQGDRARLDHATNTATLTGSVVLTDATTRTTAQSAVFTQGSNQLRADGHVLSTDLRSGPGIASAAPRSAAGTFSSVGPGFAPEPSHVSAEHLVADTARGRATYSGNGRLWQGQSVIEGDTIELDSASHVLVARGHVRGVFPQAPWTAKPSDTAPQSKSKAAFPPFAQSRGQNSAQASQAMGHPEALLGRVAGGLLTYWETESRARVEQNASADSVQGSIQAQQIDLFFSTPSDVNATKQLSRAVATGDVAVHQEDRRGTSNRAEYTASEGKFVLSEGKPTLYDSTGDTTTGRQLTFYFADDRIVVDSEEGTKTVTLHRVEK